MALNSYDNIISALTSGYGQPIMFTKASITSVAGYWYDLFPAAGIPSAGAYPTGKSGIALNKTTVGSLDFNNAGLDKSLYALSLAAGGGTQNNLVLYDRLWHCGGFTLATTGAQAVLDTQAPTRYTDGIGNKIGIVMTTASPSSGTPTISVAYTNENDVTDRVASVTLAVSQPVNRIFWLNLQAGDRGVKSIQSVTVTGNPASGAITVFMFNDKSFIYVPFAGNQFVERDLILQLTSIPKIEPDACLCFMCLPSGTATGTFYGKLQLLEG